jgi:hypothetical protein
MQIIFHNLQNILEYGMILKFQKHILIMQME